MNITLSKLLVKNVLDSPFISLNERKLAHNFHIRSSSFSFFAKSAFLINNRQYSTHFDKTSFKNFISTPVKINTQTFSDQIFSSKISPNCDHNIAINTCSFINCTSHDDAGALDITCDSPILIISKSIFTNCHSTGANYGCIHANNTKSTAIYNTCFTKCSAKKQYQIFFINVKSKAAFNVSGMHESGYIAQNELHTNNSFIKICDLVSGTQRISFINSTHNCVGKLASGLAISNPFEVDLKFCNFGFLMNGFALERKGKAEVSEKYKKINAFHSLNPGIGSLYLDIFGSISESVFYNVTYDPFIHGNKSCLAIIEKCVFDQPLIDIKIVDDNGINNRIVQFKECTFAADDITAQPFSQQDNLICYSFNPVIDISFVERARIWVNNNPHIIGFSVCLVLSIIAGIAYWKSKNYLAVKVPIAFANPNVDKHV